MTSDFVGGPGQSPKAGDQVLVDGQPAEILNYYFAECEGVVVANIKLPDGTHTGASFPQIKRLDGSDFWAKGTGDG